MAIAADQYDPPAERRPGDFRRSPQGAPWVRSLTKTRKRPGKKADLIALCANEGIEVPEKATVAKLHELLGPEPAFEAYGRPSGLGKQIENQSALQKWSERAVALGLFLTPELWEALQDLDPAQLILDDADARKLLDEIAVKAKAAAQAGIAAERGTHTHELTEDLDLERDPVERMKAGEELGIPAAAQLALVEAWEKMLMLHGFEVLAVEASVVDDIWRQAGTLDRIVRLTRDIRFITATGEFVTIEAGTVLVLDVKTGRLRLDQQGFVSYWHGYAVQCASYAQATPYDVETDTRAEWGFEIDQRWAIIAHLDVLTAITEGKARCRLVLVDLAAGREAGERCVWARQWEKRTDVFSIPTDDLMVEVEVEQIAAPPPDLRSSPVTAPEVGAAPSAPEVLPPSVEPVAPATPAALAPTSAAGEGAATVDDALALADRPFGWSDADRKALAAAWPAGLPAPGKIRRGEAAWTAEQLEQAREIIDSIDPFNIVIPPAPPEPPATPPPPPRDGPASDDEVDAVMADISSAGASVRAQMNGWLSEAKLAGRPWHPRIVRTERSIAITRAAHHLAVMFAGGDDAEDYARAVLAVALGTDAAEHPATPIGAALAELTIDEADLVGAICTAIAEGDPLTLQFSDDGTPVIVGDPAALAA